MEPFAIFSDSGYRQSLERQHGWCHARGSPADCAAGDWNVMSSSPTSVVPGLCNLVGASTYPTGSASRRDEPPFENTHHQKHLVGRVHSNQTGSGVEFQFQSQFQQHQLHHIHNTHQNNCFLSSTETKNIACTQPIVRPPQILSGISEAFAMGVPPPANSGRRRQSLRKGALRMKRSPVTMQLKVTYNYDRTTDVDDLLHQMTSMQLDGTAAVVAAAVEVASRLRNSANAEEQGQMSHRASILACHQGADVFTWQNGISASHSSQRKKIQKFVKKMTLHRRRRKTKSRMTKIRSNHMASTASSIVPTGCAADLTPQIGTFSTSRSTFPLDSKHIALIPRVYEVLRYDARNRTKKRFLYRRVQVAARNDVDDTGSEDECPICLSCLNSNVVETFCGHKFHGPCLLRHLRSRSFCPLCRTGLKERWGTSPSGSMTIASVCGRENHERNKKLIEVKYVIPSGSWNDSKGQISTEMKTRKDYLPDNESGRNLLSRLKYTFTHGMTFTLKRGNTLGTTIPYSSITFRSNDDSSYLKDCNVLLDKLNIPSAEFCSTWVK